MIRWSSNAAFLVFTALLASCGGPPVALVSNEIQGSKVFGWSSVPAERMNKPFLYVSWRSGATPTFSYVIMVPHAAGVVYMEDGPATIVGGVYTQRVRSVASAGTPAGITRFVPSSSIPLGAITKVAALTGSGGGTEVVVVDADNDTMTAFTGPTPVSSMAPSGGGEVLYGFLNTTATETITVQPPVGTLVNVNLNTGQPLSIYSHRYAVSSVVPDPHPGTPGDNFTMRLNLATGRRSIYKD
ncbi:MAG: hypothetical protein IT229_07090 [Flavobacteriales bacterium]|nr:hypothetical protein [Flavobacteriales bacterium]